MPLILGPQVLGVLSIRTRREQGFSSEDLAITTAFAAQAAIALENARLYREAEERADKLRALSTRVPCERRSPTNSSSSASRVIFVTS